MAWPLEVLEVVDRQGENARKASEWPSTTSNVSLVGTVTLASPIVCFVLLYDSVWLTPIISVRPNQKASDRRTLAR